MSKGVLPHPWDPPNPALPFPVSHSWIYRTPWSSCPSSGGVLKPGAALGHSGRTAVVSHWTLHQKGTGNMLSPWPPLRPVTHWSRCCPGKWKIRSSICCSEYGMIKCDTTSLRCVHEALAPDSELQSPWGDWLSGNQSKMSQIRRAPRHFVLSSYPNGAPEEETYSNLQTIPDTTEQMEFDISSATQVGRQLALIGDEFNRRYHRTLEETLLHLARVVAISVFQTCNVIKSIIRSCGDVSNNWTKRITGYGGWTCRLPVRCLCQKLVPAALLVAAFWWAMNYGL